MDDSDDIGFTVTTFKNVLANDQHRLAVSVVLRNHIRQQLEQGVEPDHYRMRWLRRGINVMVRVLEQLGREFNAANPTDKFSVHDMMDVANSVVTTLSEQIEEEPEHKGEA